MTINNLHGELAHLIRSHRKKSGINQQKLAQLAGVGKTVVFDLEHGKQTVQLDTLLKILNVLNVTVRFSSPLIDSGQIKKEIL